jgi:hypothetical protein
MKKLIMLFLIFGLMFLSCSDECEGENPSVRLTNNGTDKADIQIKTSGGNTVNINNVEAGTTSESKEFAPGEIEFTINIKDVPEPIVYNLTIIYCYDYTVTINPDNSVSRTEKGKD